MVLDIARFAAGRRSGAIPLVRDDGTRLAQLLAGESLTESATGAEYIMRIPNAYGTREARRSSGNRGFRGIIGALRVHRDTRTLVFAAYGFHPKSGGFGREEREICSH